MLIVHESVAHVKRVVDLLNLYLLELLGADGAVHLLGRLEAVLAPDVIELLCNIPQFRRGEFNKVGLKAPDLLKVLRVVGQVHADQLIT